MGKRKLRTPLTVNLLAVFCVVAWRVFWLSMLGRTEPRGSPALVLTAEECRVLDRLVPARPVVGAKESTLAAYLVKVARLGGYLARAKDPPPGHTVMWRGLCRLADLSLPRFSGHRGAWALVG